jgi:hypothetical protein
MSAVIFFYLYSSALPILLILYLFTLYVFCLLELSFVLLIWIIT